MESSVKISRGQLANVFKEYDDIDALKSDQANQSSNRLYKVIDASADPNLTFPSGETKLHAYYEYKETPNSDIDDYDLISAPYSDSSGGIDLSTGLEAIDEGNGIGWRLKGTNPDNYGNIGKDAIDLGASDTASNSVGATGDNSTVSGGYQNEASDQYSTVGGGYNNEASGGNSTVGGGSENEASGNFSTIGGGSQNEASGVTSTIGGGVYNRASDNYSTVGGGQSNKASGEYSTVGGGYQNEASGDYSAISGGFQNLAKTFGEFLGGLWSTIKEGNATTWIGTDRIFGIGNGTSELDRSDAFNVYKNGVAELPSATNALINTLGAKALITKEYADANYSGGGTGGVQSVTGDGVDNTDPENPVLTFPTASEIEAVTSKVDDEPSGSDKVVNMVSLTQVEYDSGTPNPDTFYIITDA